MKKKIGLIITVAAVMAVILSIGVVGAFQTNSVKASQNLNVQGLSIALNEEKNITNKGDKSVVPGSTLSEALNVENTADMDVYVRVTIQKYFTDPNGNKVYSITNKGVAQDINNELIEVVSNAEASGWIVVRTDTEETVMYYTLPMEAGAVSTDFLDKVLVSKDMGNDYQGQDLSANFVVKTDAIQKEVAASAMMSEWGVLPTFDGDVIVSIAE